MNRNIHFTYLHRCMYVFTYKLLTAAVQNNYLTFFIVISANHKTVSKSYLLKVLKSVLVPSSHLRMKKHFTTLFHKNVPDLLTSLYVQLLAYLPSTLIHRQDNRTQQLMLSDLYDKHMLVFYNIDFFFYFNNSAVVACSLGCACVVVILS